MMRDETGARAEDRMIEATPAHEPQLVASDRLAQLVVAERALNDCTINGEPGSCCAIRREAATFE